MLFLLAVVARTLAPADAAPLLDTLARAARRTLPLVLFLIGASLTPAALRALGPHPVVHAVLLWLGMATALLAAVVTLADRGGYRP